MSKEEIEDMIRKFWKINKPFSILDKYEKEEYIEEKKKRIDRFKYWTPNDY